MKKIFLCSSFADVASVLSESVAIPLKGKTVAFIPTASIHEEYTQYVEDGRAALDALGLIVKELEISQCSRNKTEEVLNDCDCIYVSGGNTFFLMQELRRTGADRYITEQVGKGKTYIGESAGAMILAPNIEYAKDMMRKNPGISLEAIAKSSGFLSTSQFNKKFKELEGITPGAWSKHLI